MKFLVLWELELSMLRPEIVKSVMQMPEYAKTLKAFQKMQFDISKSPPFRKLPPVKSIKTNSPRMIKFILDTAEKTFPSPRLPVSLLIRIIEQSRDGQIGDVNLPTS